MNGGSNPHPHHPPHTHTPITTHIPPPIPTHTHRASPCPTPPHPYTPTTTHTPHTPHPLPPITPPTPTHPITHHPRTPSPTSHPSPNIPLTHLPSPFWLQSPAHGLAVAAAAVLESVVCAHCCVQVNAPIRHRDFSSRWRACRLSAAGGALAAFDVICLAGDDGPGESKGAPGALDDIRAAARGIGSACRWCQAHHH